MGGSSNSANRVPSKSVERSLMGNSRSISKDKVSDHHPKVEFSRRPRLNRGVSWCHRHPERMKINQPRVACPPQALRRRAKLPWGEATLKRLHQTPMASVSKSAH